jgi:hypothetical protein
MPFFSIGYQEKERLEVSLLRAPSDQGTGDDDWTEALVQVEVGGFRAAVEIYMCVSDMVRFKEQLEPLYKNLDGVAEFKTIEGQLYIRIEVDKLGHVQATGFLAGDFGSRNKLEFEIRFDQTLLWHTISEIDEALFELSRGAA